MTNEVSNPQEQGQTAVDPQKERMWAMFCHLSALSSIIGIPFGNIIAPLVIWLIKKNEMPLVNKAGIASLNFQISMTIYSILASFLIVIVIGIPILIGLVITDIVLVIIASVKTNNNEEFSYPITINFIKSN